MKLKSLKTCKNETNVIELKKCVYRTCLKMWMKYFWQLFFSIDLFLFKFVFWLKWFQILGKKKQQISYFQYVLCLQFSLIDDQWSTFFSSIRVNYARLNLVRAKGCTT